MKENVLSLFHAAAFLAFGFAVYYDLVYTHIPIEIGRAHNAYAGKFKFLTFWDAVGIIWRSYPVIIYAKCLYKEWTNIRHSEEEKKM